jgi:aldose 1-epimerase
MAPWCGRVRRGRFEWDGVTYQLRRNANPHAIHGTVFDQAWQVEESSESECRIRGECGPEWPLGGWVRQTFRLDPGGLDLEMEVHAGDAAMPASAGWHPWWRRHLSVGGEVELDIELGDRWERDDEGIPTGKVVPAGPRPPEGWDDCFDRPESGRPPVIRWPGAAELTIESECDCVVVFDQPAHAVCVEPQTAPPDALNLGPASVLPGAPLVARMRWSWVLG